MSAAALSARICPSKLASTDWAFSASGWSDRVRCRYGSKASVAAE